MQHRLAGWPCAGADFTVSASNRILRLSERVCQQIPLPRGLRSQAAFLTSRPFHYHSDVTTRPCGASGNTLSTAQPSASSHGTAQGELGLPLDFGAKYEVGTTLLGYGSFGSVHPATHITTGRQFAVKKLRKDLPRSHNTRGTGRISRQKLLRRIRREIDTLRALDGCASAISFEGAYETDQSVYLVMDVCHGGDLETLFKSCGALAERHAAMVVYEVLRLLSACHSCCILHGDVKPSNFLLAPGNPLCPVPIPPAGMAQEHHQTSRPGLAAEPAEAEAGGLKSIGASSCIRRLESPLCPLPLQDRSASSVHVPYAGGWLKGIDFGCSNDAPDGVMLNKMTGTPAFMAPEVYARSFGRPADMWSLGVLAYQALSDRLPFWDSEESMLDNSLEGLKAAVAHPIPLDYGPWLSTSPAARDLVSGLLQHEVGLRLTAEEALRHPWFSQHGIGDVGGHCETHPGATPDAVNTAAEAEPCSVLNNVLPTTFHHMQQQQPAIHGSD